MSTGRAQDWFERQGPRAGSRDAQASDKGLRFQCTLCGNCCSGSEGYVGFTQDEAKAIAERLGVTLDYFMEHYTHDTRAGRSFIEKDSDFGKDCVFLDRETIPGKAVCGIYEDRPMQCKTWPFWPYVVNTEHAWRKSAVGCPGIDRGSKVIKPEEIRIQRARTPM